MQYFSAYCLYLIVPLAYILLYNILLLHMYIYCLVPVLFNQHLLRNFKRINKTSNPPYPPLVCHIDRTHCLNKPKIRNYQETCNIHLQERLLAITVQLLKRLESHPFLCVPLAVYVSRWRTFFRVFFASG